MIYKSHFVLPITQDPIEDGEVLVRDGRIVAVGRDLADSVPDEPVEDLGHAVILPGLVNAHSHLDYTIVRGLFDDEAFFPWIRRLTEVGALLQYDDFLSSSRLGALQLVRSGVTAVGDSTFSGAAVEAITEAGIRGIVYQETFGPDPTKDYSDQIDLLAERVGELASKADDKVSIGVSPHSVYTASERLLRRVTDLALDQGLPVAIHVAETAEEVDLIKFGAGTIADFYSSLGYEVKPRGKTPVAYLHDIGILGRKTVAAHCVHVTDEDLAILAEEGCSVAHCPKSNAKLGVGIAPLSSIVGRGIMTGIGTDSAASDGALDMFEEMRFAVLLQRGLERNVASMDAKRIIELATLGGAVTLGLDREIGSIEPGKQADLIAIDLSQPSSFPGADPYSALVYCCSAADLIFTMVDGEIIYRSGEYFRVDKGEIGRQAALAAAKLPLE